MRGLTPRAWQGAWPRCIPEAKDNMTPDRERHRRFRITLRVTADERRSLTVAARRSGLCLSAFIRLALLRVKPMRAARRPAVETELLAALLTSLGEIATLLHQIAKSVSVSGNSLLPSIERDLLRTLGSLRGLRSDLLRAMGRKATA
jgi:hypothetical protein